MKKHLINLAWIISGILLYKFGLWLFEPNWHAVIFSFFFVFTGSFFIIYGLYDYLYALKKWYDKRIERKKEIERQERLRRLIEEEEKRREEHRKRTAELMKSLNRVVEKAQKLPEKIETTGEILKRLGIKKERRKKARKKKVIELKKVKEEKEIPSFLEPLIDEFVEKGEIYIDKNMHYGRLRGKDIARALVKELKKRNIDFEVKYGDYDAKIKRR